MGRTVTALYDTRAEAETVRARLAAELSAPSARIIDKGRVSTLDELNLSPDVAEWCREALNGGAHLLAAEVPDQESADRIIKLLEETPSVSSAARDAEKASQTAIQPSVRPVGAGVEETVIAEERIPVLDEELRIGKRLTTRGGARVRTALQDEPVQEQITLRRERIETDARPVERRLSKEDVNAAGLLKDRVIEVSEMTEEPVIKKEAFVREEVVLKKTVEEHTEIVEDTVRKTHVEVKDLPSRP